MKLYGAILGNEGRNHRGRCGLNVSDLITARDVAKRLRVSLPYIYKIAAAGRLPCIRIPCPGEGQKKEQTLVRFKPEDVDEFIEKHAQR